MNRFSGTFTALVTPFLPDGSVDFDAYERLIDDQIYAGIEGIVVLGTTGESPTITHEEFHAIVQCAVTKAAKRCLVIVGTGSNDTRKTIAVSREAKELSADALLIVNPYYNKPTQEGLYLHFTAIAEAVDIPQILYNIKGRTAVNIETETLRRIVDGQPNIVGVKEASGDLNQMKEVIARTPDDFSVLSGDDNMTCELIAAGGDGVVSVLSNLLPGRVKAMVDLARAGDRTRAQSLHEELLPLMKGCFLETNPIPIKTALALQGKMGEIFRLPMCRMGAEARSQWEKILLEHKVLEKNPRRQDSKMPSSNVMAR